MYFKRSSSERIFTSGLSKDLKLFLTPRNINDSKGLLNIGTHLQDNFLLKIMYYHRIDLLFEIVRKSNVTLKRIIIEETERTKQD